MGGRSTEGGVGLLALFGGWKIQDLVIWGVFTMDSVKRDRVWAPDPIEGYILGYVTDFNGETLTVEQADDPRKVSPRKLAGGAAWYCMHDMHGLHLCWIVFLDCQCFL